MNKHVLVIVPYREGDYSEYLLAPLGMSEHDAKREVNEAVTRIQKDAEWTIETVLKSLGDGGFVVPNVVRSDATV